MSFVNDPVVYSDESMTKQSFREEVDINRIVARAREGQMVAHVARGVPSYLDVSDVGDYKGALDMIRKTDAWFARLPAKVREVFKNDASEFLDAMDTDVGRAKLVELGVLPPIPETVSVPPVAAPVATTPAGVTPPA